MGTWTSKSDSAVHHSVFLIFENNCEFQLVRELSPFYSWVPKLLLGSKYTRISISEVDMRCKHQYLKIPRPNCLVFVVWNWQYLASPKTALREANSGWYDTVKLAAALITTTMDDEDELALSGGRKDVSKIRQTLERYSRSYSNVDRWQLLLTNHWFSYQT